MKKVLTALLIVLLAGAIAFNVFIVPKKAGELNELAEKSEVSLDDLEEIGVADIVFDNSEERVNTDIAKIEEFVAKMFSWNSVEEYKSLRNECVEEYGDSLILATFMPQDFEVETEDGPKSWMEYTGETKTYKDFSAICVNNGMEGNNYYLCNLNVDAVHFGEVSEKGYSFIVQVDKDGGFVDLENSMCWALMD